MSEFWSSVFGSLVGGGLALMGSWFTLTKTQEAERTRREEERRERRDAALRQAYVDWQASMHRGLYRSAELLFVTDRSDLARLAEEMKNDHEAMGVAVELLESDSVARGRLKKVVGLWGETLDKVNSSAPIEERRAARAAFANNLTEFSEWLSESRFRF